MWVNSEIPSWPSFHPQFYWPCPKITLEIELICYTCLMSFLDTYTGIISSHHHRLQTWRILSSFFIPFLLFLVKTQVKMIESSFPTSPYTSVQVKTSFCLFLSDSRIQTKPSMESNCTQASIVWMGNGEDPNAPSQQYSQIEWLWDLTTTRNI